MEARARLRRDSVSRFFLLKKKPNAIKKEDAKREPPMLLERGDPYVSPSKAHESKFGGGEPKLSCGSAGGRTYDPSQEEESKNFT